MHTSLSEIIIELGVVVDKSKYKLLNINLHFFLDASFQQRFILL